MDDASLRRLIVETFPGVEELVADGDSYFYYRPDPSVPHDHRFPFATLVTADRHDSFSNLDRPGVYRFNVGVSKETFGALFGEACDASNAGSIDFAELDRLLPHPVYGKMYWVSVLNPSEATFAKRVRPLVQEAHDRAKRKHDAREGVDEH